MMVISTDPKRKREESVANLDQRIRCVYRLDKSWGIVFGTFTILQDNWVKNIITLRCLINVPVRLLF